MVILLYVHILTSIRMNMYYCDTDVDVYARTFSSTSMVILPVAESFMTFAILLISFS